MQQETPRKTAVVIGSGGPRIGRTIAQTLAEHGYDIAVHYHRSADEAGHTVGQLRKLGVHAERFSADVRKAAEVERLHHDVLQAFGRVDVLVTAQGAWPTLPLADTKAEDVTRLFEINTLGTFLCCQHFGLQMTRQSAGGAIVTMGDWATGRPYLGYAAYFVSKGAIPALTCTLAVELAALNPAVRINCIVPGPIMPASELSPQEQEESRQKTLLKRWGRPDDIAVAVLFLVRNDYVTGSCLTVDGGRSIWC